MDAQRLHLRDINFMSSVSRKYKVSVVLLANPGFHRDNIELIKTTFINYDYPIEFIISKINFR